MSAIKLNLRMSNGKFETFIQDFVPFRKRLEYVKEEAELVDRVNEDGEPDGAISMELSEFRAGFVAELFEDKRVTKKAILDGLEVEDSGVIMDIIMQRVLGYKEEDIKEDVSEKKGTVKGNDLYDTYIELMKQIIKTHPGWSINTILETDIQYLDDIMFSTSPEDATSNKQVHSQKVISMEDWFKEIQS